MKQLLLTALLIFSCVPILLLAANDVSTSWRKARITYYTQRGKTASGINTRMGICAVSPDLERMGFKLGEYVEVKNLGTFLIADRTARNVSNTIDIWLPGIPAKNAPIRQQSHREIKLIYSND